MEVSGGRNRHNPLHSLRGPYDVAAKQHLLRDGVPGYLIIHCHVEFQVGRPEFQRTFAVLGIDVLLSQSLLNLGVPSMN